MIRVSRHDLGPRLFVCGRRVHHGACGALAAVVGLVLMVHDRADCREWFRRCRS